MSKTTKFSLLAIGAGLVLIAIGFIITGGKMSAFAGKKASTNHVHYDYECSGKITAVDFTDSYESVLITTGDVDKATVSYYEFDGHDQVIVKESNGTLSFERKSTGNSWVMFDFNFESTKTVITLPKDYEGPVNVNTTSGSIAVKDLKNSDVKAKSSSGSIKIDNVANSKEISGKATSGSVHVSSLASSGDITLESTSGSIRADGVKCKDFSGQATSGSVHIDNAECDNLKAQSNSGSVKVSDATVKEDITVKSASGSSRTENATCSSVNAESSSGSVTFKDVTADKVNGLSASGGIHLDNLAINKSAAFKANSGSINGTIKGKETDFSIIASTTSGSCNLKGSRDGEKTLDASTTSGSINIKFE